MVRIAGVGAIDNTVQAGGVRADNIPAGLVPSYEYISDTAMRVTLERPVGTPPPDHDNIHDVNNVRFNFSNDIVASGIRPDALEDISINFGEEVVLDASRKNFKEGILLDDGSMANTTTLEIQGAGELEYTEKSFVFASRINRGHCLLYP